MDLKNVKFYWNDNIYITSDVLRVKSIPEPPAVVFDLDEPDSFYFDVYGGSAKLSFKVMDYLMNHQIFKGPGQSLRNIEVSAIEIEKNADSIRKLKIKGEMDLLFWISFEMTGSFKLNKKNGFIEIKSEDIRALGMPFAGDFLDTFGVSLDNLIIAPKGRGIKIIENTIIIDPFKLFSRPRISGVLSNIELEKDAIKISFKRKPIVIFPGRPVGARNDILMYKGDVKIGGMRVVDAYMQIIDKDPGDYLEFNIDKYFLQVSKSLITVKKNKSIVVITPDYTDILENK